MSDFFVADDEKPVGGCIWFLCSEPATAVLKCKAKPLSMDVCAKHAEKFMSASVVPGEKGDKIGISIPGTIGPDKSRLH